MPQLDRVVKNRTSCHAPAEAIGMKQPVLVACLKAAARLRGPSPRAR